MSNCIARTETWRLLPTFKFYSPHKPQISTTILWIAKNYPHEIKFWYWYIKVYSTRSASTFKAALQDASTESILKWGCWSNKSTLQWLYNKNIVKEGQIFQKMVLQPVWDLLNTNHEWVKIGKRSVRSTEILWNTFLN